MKGNFSGNATLAVLDRGYFLEYYGNRTVANKTKACAQMFNKIKSKAYDAICNDNGDVDFLRKVPCPRDKICVDEDKPQKVVKDYAFTFRIEDYSEPR